MDTGVAGARGSGTGTRWKPNVPPAATVTASVALISFALFLQARFIGLVGFLDCKERLHPGFCAKKICAANANELIIQSPITQLIQSVVWSLRSGR